MTAELNFPIGSKAPLDFGLREGGRRWDLPLHLWDAIFCSMTQQPPPHLRNDPYAKNILQKLSDVLNEGYRSESLQRRPHIVLLDTEFYKKRMLAELTEWMLLYIKDEIISHLTRGLEATGLLDDSTSGSFNGGGSFTRSFTRKKNPDEKAAAAAMKEKMTRRASLARVASSNKDQRDVIDELNRMELEKRSAGGLMAAIKQEVMLPGDAARAARRASAAGGADAACIAARKSWAGKQDPLSC